MYNYPFLELSKIVTAIVGSLLPVYYNKVVQKNVFGAIFDIKKSNPKILSKIFTQKNRIKQIVKPSLSLNLKPKTLSLKILTSVCNIEEHLVKNTENENKTNGIHSTFPKTLNLDNSLKKENLFNSTFHAGQAF